MITLFFLVLISTEIFSVFFRRSPACKTLGGSKPLVPPTQSLHEGAKQQPIRCPLKSLYPTTPLKAILSLLSLLTGHSPYRECPPHWWASLTRVWTWTDWISKCSLLISNPPPTIACSHLLLLRRWPDDLRFCRFFLRPNAETQWFHPNLGLPDVTNNNTAD